MLDPLFKITSHWTEQKASIDYIQASTKDLIKKKREALKEKENNQNSNQEEDYSKYLVFQIHQGNNTNHTKKLSATC